MEREEGSLSKVRFKVTLGVKRKTMRQECGGRAIQFFGGKAPSIRLLEGLHQTLDVGGRFLGEQRFHRLRADAHQGMG